MLPRGHARRAADASAGPDLLAVPAVQGGGERGDDHLTVIGEGCRRVLLEHERLLRGSTATRQRAPNPLEDEFTNDN